MYSIPVILLYYLLYDDEVCENITDISHLIQHLRLSYTETSYIIEMNSVKTTADSYRRSLMPS